MSAESRIGVFVCHPADSDAGPVDLQAVTGWAAGLPGVSSSRTVLVRGTLDPPALRDEIRRGGLTAVVIAGYTPGYYKPAFTRAMAEAGGDPDEVRLASFREHGAMAENPLERAKEVVACAVHGVPFSLAAETESVPFNPATLVIGGGVAGIQAALEIAEAGHPVYLVERQGSIGGHMAHVRQDLPDARLRRLHPHAEDGGGRAAPEHRAHGAVRGPGGAGSRRGLPGQGAAPRHPGRRRDLRRPAPTAPQFCPVVVPSEFDVGIATRKAIYIPFPQAVPNAYLVDAEHCTWILSDGKKCGACVKKCGKAAIDLDARDEVVELEVGNIVVATGFRPSTPAASSATGTASTPTCSRRWNSSGSPTPRAPPGARSSSRP